MGLIDIMEIDPGNPDYVPILRNATNKLDMTIQHTSDLLNFENEVDVMKKVDCDLNETFDKVITQNKKMIEERGAEIQLDIPENMTVKAIPSYLESVYSNLINNALRYGTTDSSKNIKIKAAVKGNETIVSVIDHGLGIDLSKHKDKLFKLGSRFHSSISDGHGLGLFMSKLQLDAMGNIIDIESAENKGTTVNVHFHEE